MNHVNQLREALESAELRESIDDYVSRAADGCNTRQEVLDEYAQQDMPQEQLDHINKRWEEFYHKKQKWLRRYCYGDEDLMSIGLLSVRKRLAEYPDCPESWLVQRAKLDINTARKPR